MTKRELAREKKKWLAWLEKYGAAKFLDAFLRNVENAESRCIHCKQPIFVDVLVGGGVPDWSTAGGDFGCPNSADTNDDASGSHVPRKRS